MSSALSERLLNYFDPVYLISLSFLYLAYTLLFNPFLLLYSPSSFRSKWFENYWLKIGPGMALAPLQVDHIEDLMSRAHGVVLELGPGGGDQMHHYKAGKIERAYGAEPNVFLHGKLRLKASEAGLGNGKYTPINGAAQPDVLLPALQKAGLIPAGASSLPEGGVFDCIITVKSLCSAPQSHLAATIAVFQALLKPGGEFLFFEHLGNNSDPITQAYVWSMNWLWSAIMGGCRLDGKLDSVVMGMGGWEKRDLRTTGEYKGYEIFRYVKGVCKKA